MSNELTFNESFENDCEKDDKHYLSTLLDNDGDISKSLDSIVADETQQAWYRYNVVSAVLNKEYSAHSSYQFTQAISAKIADEPAIIARPRNQANHPISTVWKKVSGLAIAASVAYAMVFSVNMLNTTSDLVETASSSATPHISTSNISNSNVAAHHADENANKTSIVSDAEAAEQANLDRIQAILNNVSKSSLNVNEQLVGGEKTVSVKLKLDKLEKQVRDMKKPSEIKK